MTNTVPRLSRDGTGLEQPNWQALDRHRYVVMQVNGCMQAVATEYLFLLRAYIYVHICVYVEAPRVENGAYVCMHEHEPPECMHRQTSYITNVHRYEIQYPYRVRTSVLLPSYFPFRL